MEGEEKTALDKRDLAAPGILIFTSPTSTSSSPLQFCSLTPPTPSVLYVCFLTVIARSCDARAMLDCKDWRGRWRKMATIGVVFWWETGISLIQIFAKICSHKGRAGGNYGLQYKHVRTCGASFPCGWLTCAPYKDCEGKW